MEFGIIIDVNLEQPLKASLPIAVTERGMTVLLQPAINSFVEVLIIALQLFRESYTLLFGSTLIAFRLEQPAKAPSPIFVTELGTIIVVSIEQPMNAFSLIVVIELGIVTDVSLMHL